jgi:hypothetical protein
MEWQALIAKEARNDVVRNMVSVERAGAAHALPHGNIFP